MNRITLLGLFAAIVSQCYGEEHHLLSKDFIDEINSKQSSWVAGFNFPEDTSVDDLKYLVSLIGISSDPNITVPIQYRNHIDVKSIPSTFDAREAWPRCESIRTIRNQGNCGSCWAFATVEVMSDRLCIFSSGAIQFTFSPEELISCCSECGHGCDGGYLLQPFQYWQYNGIPSGGDENSNQGCRPYTAGASQKTPQCNKRCVDDYPKTYLEDIRHGIAAFQVTSSVVQIQNEILTNGPVAASLDVYEDFFNYKSGVYKSTSANLKGYHAVKIIGWGNENGQDYWLAANSWGGDWGDKGFFKILRGSNHCNIESAIFAGNPNINE